MEPIFTSLRVVPPETAPSEPVDLVTAKQYMRVYSDYEDDLVGALITTARMMAEQYLARSLVNQTFSWTYKPLQTPHTLFSATVNFGFWSGASPSSYTTLELPRAPVTAVNSVVLRDGNGDDITIDSSTYVCDLDLDPARLAIYWGAVNDPEQQPSTPVYPLQHIVVEFAAGYGDSNPMPQPIKQAILMLVNYLYEGRGDVEPYEIPKTIQYLLDSYKITFFGSGV